MYILKISILTQVNTKNDGTFWHLVFGDGRFDVDSQEYVGMPDFDSRFLTAEFFSELDRDCGKLSFHSSTQDLVKYVREGVYRLRKRLAAASADT